MARCEDCIHGECCRIYIPVRTILCGDKADERCKWFKSTADVVPKSEVERLEEELAKANADVKNYMKVAEYQQGLSVKRYHEIKRLNEDIERLQKALDAYEETSGLKQAKAEVAREIFAEIEENLTAKEPPIVEMDYFKFLELKDKYIPKDCRDCRYFVGCECFSGMTCNMYEEKKT